MVELKATVRNQDGIHCRPAAAIVKSVTDYSGKIRVSCANGETDAHSVFGLLGLALLPETEVTIQVCGPDEENRCRELAELFETHFDFPRR
jgi:phosphocarrier protein HPr